MGYEHFRINQLSPEHLQLIFSQLGFNDLKLVRQVCKLWKEVNDQSVLLDDKQVYCKFTHDYLDITEFRKFGHIIEGIDELLDEDKEGLIEYYREHTRSTILQQNTTLLRRICGCDKYLFCSCIIGERPIGPEEEPTQLDTCELAGWSSVGALTGMVISIGFLILIIANHLFPRGTHPFIIIGIIFGLLLSGACVGAIGTVATSCISTRFCANRAAERSEREARSFFGLFEKRAKTDQMIYMEEGAGITVVDPR